MTRRYVILGNGIAGQTCAEELRVIDANAEITLLAAEAHPLYSRVALPSFLRGQIREDKVMMRAPADYERRNIDIHFRTRAARIDPHDKCVRSDRGQSFPYDALLIATGGRPKALPFADRQEDDVFLGFQTLDDAKRIIAQTDAAKRVLVLGGSFIGYELAEGIAHRGKTSVTWMMRGQWFLRAVLDAEAGELCRRLGEEAGVEFVLSDDVQRICGANDGYVAETAKGRRIPFDVLAYGVGLDLNLEAAAGTGVDVRQGIVTDQRLRTNVDGIYAAGDIAVFFDLMTNRHNQIGTWDNALGHGRVAARNMAGREEDYRDVSGYTTTMFGTSMAVLGITSGLPGLESVRDFSYEKRYYRRLFFQDNCLLGAILIGPPKGRKKLIEIMRTRRPVERSREDFLDPATL